VVFLAV